MGIRANMWEAVYFIKGETFFTSVFLLLCSDILYLHWNHLCFPTLCYSWHQLSLAGEPSAPKSCGDRGCPREGDGSGSPLGRTPAFRYPTFLSCCGGCALPSGHGRRSLDAYPPPHALLDLPPGGTQPPRLSLPVYLLHLPLLLFHHQCPAQPPLAWLSCPLFFFPHLTSFLLLFAD